MKPSSPIEPGVISAFRLFTMVRLTLLLVNSAVEVIVNGWPVSPPVIFLLSLCDVVLLLGFLSWQGLSARMKSWYLPVGIILASALPILEMHFAFEINATGFVQGTALVGIWQSVLVLLIPLFIIGWQYSFHSVVLFSVATSLADVVPFMIQMPSILPAGSYYPILGVMFIRMVFFLFIGYMVVKLMTTQRGLRAELTSANNRLAQYAGTLEHLTISRERNRLARELHDVLAHTLSGVAVELEAVKALWNQDAAQAQSMLDRSLRSTRDGLTETRRALQALRASPLEDLGLGLAVRGLAESAANRSSLKLETVISDDLPEYPPDIEQCIYRVAQESLANISEHSGARTVRLQLVRENGMLKLVVADDGRGFEPGSVDAKVQFGLAGMRERAEAIGARLDILAQAGLGTVVTLEYGGAQ